MTAFLSFLRLKIILLCLLMLASCSWYRDVAQIQNAKLAQRAAAQIQSAWVELGEQGQAQVRVITRAVNCPDLIQDGVAAMMQVRAEPATERQRITISSTSQSKPSIFDVLVCQAPLNIGVKVATVAGKVLPLPKTAPLKIVVLGDTGCRLKSEGNSFQSCNDANDWAFSQVAQTAAGFAPDLVIHVGDYHYRENACPADNVTCANSPWGYGWDTWRADFFAPAAPLLTAAPWVFTRGNHELCNRAGQGWQRFLDPYTLTQARDCNQELNDVMGDYGEPYAVPLGGGSQLIVFDSAKAFNKPLERNSRVYKVFADQFAKVDKLAEQAPFSIFISHHPILGFAPNVPTKQKANKDNLPEVYPGNTTLQSVMQERHAERLFPKNVGLVLAGHVHLFEAITFSSDHPMQIVAGNGASSPDAALPLKIASQTTPYAAAKVAQLLSFKESGFTTLERASATSLTWQIKAYDKQGALRGSCVVSQTEQHCD